MSDVDESDHEGDLDGARSPRPETPDPAQCGGEAPPADADPEKKMDWIDRTLFVIGALVVAACMMWLFYSRSSNDSSYISRSNIEAIEGSGLVIALHTDTVVEPTDDRVTVRAAIDETHDGTGKTPRTLVFSVPRANFTIDIRQDRPRSWVSAVDHDTALPIVASNAGAYVGTVVVDSLTLHVPDLRYVVSRRP